MDDRGHIIAIDISAKGIRRVEQNARRLGLTSIQALRADLTRGLTIPLDESYDRILVDAPCSGFGTLRSHPEIKWTRSESDIRRLSQLQKKLLIRAASYLKPGGVLVYSTCTLIEDENEKVVEDFLKYQEGFVLEEAAGYLDDHRSGQVRAAIHQGRRGLGFDSSRHVRQSEREPTKNPRARRQSFGCRESGRSFGKSRRLFS